MKRLEEEPMFFANAYDTIFIRSVPTLGYFIKFKGEKEVFAKKGNSVVMDVVTGYREITEEEYNNFN